MSSLHAKVKKIQSKLKALECPHLSHCKSMGIFADAHGQLTQQSVVGSGQNSNSVETLWLWNEKDQLKNEGD